MNRIQTFVNNWNNAPWTARGLRFKTAVEWLVIWAGALVILGLAGMWQ